jgi:hypothetical protein
VIPVCNPQCPPGYECTTAGCAPDSSAPEFEERETPAVSGHDRRSSVSLDVSSHTQSPQGETVTIVAPVLLAAVPIDRWTLEFALPLAYYHVSIPGFFFQGASDSGFEPGNPTLIAKYHGEFSSKTGRGEGFVGLGMSAPVARIDNGDENGLARLVGYAGALGVRGLWNYWWYFPNSLSLMMPFGVDYVTDRGFDVGAEAALAAYFFVGQLSHHQPVANAQFGFRVGYASDDVRAGVWMRLVRIPGDSNDDQTQASVEPYLRGIFGQGFIETGFLMNLDKPLGPNLDEGSIWGFRVAGGAEF